jgi:anti-sigma B factor antagonist
MIRVDTDVEEGVAVLQPQGRLTMVTAPQLRQVVAETVTSGRLRFVVDLSATEFLDSSGLGGALIAGLKTARQAGGDLRIACLGPQPATVLKLTNLDRVLRPHANVAEAVRVR